MQWRNWPYWIRGGMLAVPLSIVGIPLSVVATRTLGAGQDVVLFLAPEFFLTALDLGMRGTPAGTTEIVTKTLAVSVFFLLRIFLMGAILGAIYGFFARRKKQKYFSISLVVIFLMALIAMSYRTQDVYKAYSSVNTPQECEAASKQFIDNFSTEYCYHLLAIKQADVHICNLINAASSDDANADDRWFCYEEVAHAKNDPSLCELIPANTFNEHRVSTGRRDGCFLWFKQCEKMVDPEWKAHCLESRGESF